MRGGPDSVYVMEKTDYRERNGGEMGYSAFIGARAEVAWLAGCSFP